MCLGTYEGNENKIVVDRTAGVKIVTWLERFMIEHKESFKAVRGIVL